MQEDIGTVVGAQSVVTYLIERDLRQIGQEHELTITSPDPRDPGKFTLSGRVGRVVHVRDGFYVKINKDWLNGSPQLPEVHRVPFHWYAFAVRVGGPSSDRHYFLCDYLQLRSWVLEFDAPLGDDHANESQWRGGFDLVGEDGADLVAYFRWGDETPGEHARDSRYIKLDNVAEVLERESETALAPLISSDDSTDPMETSTPVDDDPEEWLMRYIRARRGQHRFRRALLDLYENKCAITGHGPIDVLEAAHIQPHAEEGRNSVDNGLLLRADIHTLFDLRLLWVEPGSLTVRIAPSLQDSPYSELDGKQLKTRRDGSQPNHEYLVERSRSR